MSESYFKMEYVMLEFDSTGNPNLYRLQDQQMWRIHSLNVFLTLTKSGCI